MTSDLLNHTRLFAIVWAPMESIPTTCILCEAAHPTRCPESYKEYTLWSCASCLGRFGWPFVNPGAEWYAHDERYAGRNRDPLLTPVDSHTLLLNDHPAPGGTLLDVGCGTGNFLAAARERGYQVHGIDFDSDAIAVAQRVFALPSLRVASVADLSEESQRYDVITFFEVLEHLDAPTIFLQTVSRLLVPNGYIALSVPDADTWERLKPHDLPPRHLTRWTVASMKRFLERNGFSVIHIVQKRIPLSFLITKFHFWTKGYLSFGMVEKMQQKREPHANTPSVDTGPRMRRMKILALWKDRVFFTVPAMILWCILFFLGKTSGGLYVLAQKTTDPYAP